MYVFRLARSQAAEMAFAARHHIRRHAQEDPVYYRKLSERLETAKAISAEKKLARRGNGARETLKKWEEKSEAAVLKGDDEAAGPVLKK